MKEHICWLIIIVIAQRDKSFLMGCYEVGLWSICHLLTNLFVVVLLKILWLHVWLITPHPYQSSTHFLIWFYRLLFMAGKPLAFLAPLRPFLVLEGTRYLRCKFPRFKCAFIQGGKCNNSLTLVLLTWIRHWLEISKCRFNVFLDFTWSIEPRNDLFKYNFLKYHLMASIKVGRAWKHVHIMQWYQLKLVELERLNAIYTSY